MNPSWPFDCYWNGLRCSQVVCHIRVARFQTHTAGAIPQLVCCSVMCKEFESESRENRVDSAWRKFPRWVPSIPTPLPLQIYGVTCALRSGQTPLFHFLRLLRCRSNSGEANAVRLLNYERWAWVIPVIKSKGAGPMPHGTMVLLCRCTLCCGLRMKFPASARKLLKQAAFHFIWEIT